MASVSEDLEFWMTKLPQKLRSIPLIHLAIPGSHDSTTFAFNHNSTMSPDVRTPIQYLKFLEPVLRPVMLNWSKTQSVDINEQLKRGIRYFDLRIATKPHDDGFYFVHNLYSEKVDPVLGAVTDFLNTHPKEIIILDCQHFYGLDCNDHQHFISLLSQIFHKKMLPYMPNNIPNITLEYMAQTRQQVVIIYRSPTTKLEKSLWPSMYFPTPWPNTVSSEKLLNCLEDGLKNRNCLLGHITQCVLTPTLWYAFRNLFSSLEHKCVIPLEKHKYSWLRRQKPGIGGINIVISDFVDYQDNQFSKEVINLNRKLLDDEMVLSLVNNPK